MYKKRGLLRLKRSFLRPEQAGGLLMAPLLYQKA
jgi:hypothetical protein